MAAVPNEPDVAMPDAAVKPPTSPRKRRRRAPTSGAADDCFACQELHTSCDRRRPYCTQCLDRGKDCSGYKTTLTWGVGVASRGKLRGLSLPIAKSKKVDPVEKDPPKKGGSGGGGGGGGGGGSGAGGAASKSTAQQQPLPNDHYITPSPSSYTHHTTFGFVNVDPNAPSPSPISPQPSFQWNPPHPPSGRGAAQRTAGRAVPKRGIRRHSLQPLHVSPLPLGDYNNGPMTAHMFGGYGDSSHESAIYSPMTPTFHTLPNTMPMIKSYPGEHMVMGPANGYFHAVPEIGSWPSGKMSSSLSSDQSSRDYQEDEGFYADPVVVNTLDYLLGSQTAGPTADATRDDYKIKEEPTNDQEDILPGEIFPSENPPEHDELSLSLSFSRSIPTLSVGNTPELRFLINYYDKVISPVIVAFDGPTNPYRTHILQLASQSETLQHAIAALSASNLRMRREHNPTPSAKPRSTLSDTPHDESVRKSSIAHSILNDDINQVSDLQTNPGAPWLRELLHKGKSIQALNAQLADTKLRKDDTVLATLLMLCLYHICDTGVAKFKTQFAGVKKILALRDDTGSNTKETKWLTTMFMWFDSMTATVNDREGQFHSDIWTATGGEKEDWSLENLAGCDGRLFETISKLGRLNLLSQGKPVTNPGDPKPKPQPLPRTQEFYSMTSSTRFDGNGWASLLDDAQQPPATTRTDSRAQFWDEWVDIRKKLQEWQLDTTSLPSPMCESSLEINRLDLQHISESFRYSALLYTERLAYPHLPSSAENFQNLVAQSLFHITNVKSDVYLLWPLFITGTECVDEQHREIIRERCLDIQKDSGFFNNISGLELLERIWKDNTEDGMGDGSDGGVGGVGGVPSTVRTGGRPDDGCGSFRWRKAMTSLEGEYIVI